MLYPVGTHIDLTHLNKKPSTFTTELEPERPHRLYVPGTKIVFMRLANYTGYVQQIIQTA